MTQQEMETQALVAAVDILYCMYDREEPNYTTDKIATLMREAFEAGKAEQKRIDEEQSAKELLYAIDKTAKRTRKEVVEKADKWLRAHLPRVIENYPRSNNKTTIMLNEDMRAEFREDMEKQD